MAERGALEAPLLGRNGAGGSADQASVAKSKRPRSKVLLVVVSVLADLLMSGVTYGYSGVVGVLSTETKAFASLCEPGQTLPCPAQTRSLTAAFTLSAATMCVCGIPVGMILDAVGPRYTTVLGSLVFSLGLVSFALAPVLSDALYHAGFFFLALGGPAIITSNMNFADLFPSVASAIISAQNGAFDASSAVMFLMGKAVTGLGVSFGAVSLAYLSVPLSLVVIAVALFPDEPIGPDSEDLQGSDTQPQDGNNGDNPIVDESQRNGELWRLYRLKLASLEQSSTDPEEPRPRNPLYSTPIDDAHQPVLSHPHPHPPPHDIHVSIHSASPPSSPRVGLSPGSLKAPSMSAHTDSSFLVSPSANKLIVSQFMVGSPRSSSLRLRSGRWSAVPSDGSHSIHSGSRGSSHAGSPPPDLSTVSTERHKSPVTSPLSVTSSSHSQRQMPTLSPIPDSALFHDSPLSSSLEKRKQESLLSRNLHGHGEKREGAAPAGPDSMHQEHKAPGDPKGSGSPESSTKAGAGPLSTPQEAAASASAASRKVQGVLPPPDIYNSEVTTQLKSGVYWVLLVLSAYLVTRNNFFIGSINQQLAFAIEHHPELFPNPGATRSLYVDLFNYIMPLGGLSSIPLSAYVMVQYGMTSAFLVIGVLSCLLTGIQIAAPSLPLGVQVVGFVMYAIVRCFIFGAQAAFMGQIFGFRNFGTLLGINRFACGAVTVVQYPLISLAEHRFRGDYRPILGGFLGIELLICILFPLYLWRHVYYGFFFCPPDTIEDLET